MSRFTVEVTTPPVIDDQWDVLYAAVDAVPGTVLVENPDGPELIIPVMADNPMRAATFVEGISQVLGFQIISGEINPTPACESDIFDDFDDEETVPTTTVVTVQQWVDDIPPVRPATAAGLALA